MQILKCGEYKKADDEDKTKIKLRWKKWIELIGINYKKYEKKEILFMHILKHLNECRNLKNHQLEFRNRTFLNKINSLINLFSIYFEMYDFNFKLLSHSDYNNISDQKISYFNLINDIEAKIIKICQETDEKRPKFKYFTLINNTINDMCNNLNVKINYFLLLERLENYQRKREILFNVYEDGRVFIKKSCF